MIARVCIETGRWSFEDLCELVHPAFAALTGFINASMCVGCAAAYLMVAGQVYQAGGVLVCVCVCVCVCVLWLEIRNKQIRVA